MSFLNLQSVLASQTIQKRTPQKGKRLLEWKPTSSPSSHSSNAVWEGVGSSDLTISNTSDKGDHGLGKFQHLDGEMVMVDSQVYQFRSNGSVSQKGDEDIIAFSQAVFFKPNSHLQFDSLNRRVVLDYLDTSHPGSHNLFRAVKIEGMFQNIKLHVAPKQQH
ncbi:hypothetical protein FOCG_00352 [Fusarium oxysporum f. sp. radicis-lycopersici 26381]|nr:hypothetical protein FOWG_03035 [Fusarium oxysporum f. sp. lycopersici MN25]EXL61144.1 hypothetical protein FOCG_00352 [Fusarium oxysporum f. sp. radicis-lycopersici 26381]KAJ4167223.1 hypothetical protein NW765_009154 [Fusarium oxysporum]